MRIKKLIAALVSAAAVSTICVPASEATIWVWQDKNHPKGTWWDAEYMDFIMDFKWNDGTPVEWNPAQAHCTWHEDDYEIYWDDKNLNPLAENNVGDYRHYSWHDTDAQWSGNKPWIRTNMQAMVLINDDVAGQVARRETSEAFSQFLLKQGYQNQDYRNVIIAGWLKAREKAKNDNHQLLRLNCNLPEGDLNEGKPWGFDFRGSLAKDQIVNNYVMNQTLVKKDVRWQLDLASSDLPEEYKNIVKPAYIGEDALDTDGRDFMWKNGDIDLDRFYNDNPWLVRDVVGKSFTGPVAHVWTPNLKVNYANPTVKVLDKETRQPIEGLDLKVTTKTVLGFEGNLPQAAAPKATDANGVTKLENLRPGTYDVETVPNDNYMHSDIGEVGAAGDNNTYNVLVEPARGSIAISGIAGTYVLHSDTPGVADKEVSTANGSVTVDGLHFGDWTVTAPDGQTSEVTVTKDSQVKAAFDVPESTPGGTTPGSTTPGGTTPTPTPSDATATGAMSGKYVDAAGKPISGATIVATAPDGTKQTATTGTDGSFSFTGLTPGKYTVDTPSGSFTVDVTTEKRDLGLVTDNTKTVPDYRIDTPVRFFIGSPGITVGLKDAAGNIVDYATVGADGYVILTPTAAGKYTIVETSTAGKEVSGSNLTPITISVAGDTPTTTDTSSLSTPSGDDGSQDAPETEKKSNLPIILGIIGVLAAVAGTASLWWAHLTPEQRLSFLPPVFP